MEMESPLETSPILSPNNESPNGTGPRPASINHKEPKGNGDEKYEELSEPDDSYHNSGLSVWQACLFIILLILDYTFLTVQALIVSTGWMGLVLATVVCSGVVYTSVLLGRCWNIVRGRWQNERHPYGAICYEAYGSWASIVINMTVNVSCFALSVGVLTLTSDNLFVLGGKALGGQALGGQFCLLMVVIAVVVCPFMWLGTPRDIWQLSAVGALISTLAYLLTFIAVILDDEDMEAEADYSNLTAFVGAPPSVGHTHGTLLVHLVEICGIGQVSISTHFIVLNLQRDMKQPQKIATALCVSYAYTFALVTPLLVVTYVFQQSRLAFATADTTVLAVLNPGPLSTVCVALFLLRNIAMLVPCNNPLYQSMEERLNIPAEFTWKRVALRTVVLSIQLMIGETIPHFGIIFTLLGGICFPIINFLAPTMCYLRLRNIHTPEKYKESRTTWILETVVCWLIIVVSPIMAVLILYFMGSGIFQGKTVFTVPCFINATLAHE